VCSRRLPSSLEQIGFIFPTLTAIPSPFALHQQPSTGSLCFYAQTSAGSDVADVARDQASPNHVERGLLNLLAAYQHAYAVVFDLSTTTYPIPRPRVLSRCSPSSPSPLFPRSFLPDPRLHPPTVPPSQSDGTTQSTSTFRSVLPLSSFGWSSLPRSGAFLTPLLLCRLIGEDEDSTSKTRCLRSLLVSWMA
jgi:hypothetical protein